MRYVSFTPTGKPRKETEITPSLSADRLPSTVTVYLRYADSVERPHSFISRVAMQPSEARSLAARLTKFADIAEGKGD